MLVGGLDERLISIAARLEVSEWIVAVVDDTGTVHATEDALTVDLAVRTYHPVVIEAGLADQATPIPWLDGRELRFPPR